MSTTPSVVGNTEPDTVGKPAAGDSVLANTRYTGTEYNSSEKCTFKRGGQCNIHGTIGTKKTIVWKEWPKKKNGLFGFVRKQKTEYECHFSGGASTNSGHQEIVSRFCGVAESDLCNNGLETEKQTRKSALGGKADNLDTDTTIQGISGVGSFQTGSKLSESQQISDELKDPD